MTAPITYIPPRAIKRAAFFKRFTDAELEDMEFLALDDTTAGAAVRRQKARLRMILSIIRAMELVDLDDARLIAWVTLMETRGLLAAGRANEILNTDPSITEQA